MWWYPLIDTLLILGGSLAIVTTIFRSIPWLLIALALGAAFWFYGRVDAMLEPIFKPTPTVSHREPAPAPVVAYSQTPTPAPAPTYTAPAYAPPPPAYAYSPPPVFGGGRTVVLFPHVFGGHHR